MARSMLRDLVNGTRQLLLTQAFVSVLAVALAGWTLAVTSALIRERDRLRDRVVQLESDMGARGIVVPAAPAVISTARPGRPSYPDAANAVLRQTGIAPSAPALEPGAIVSDLFGSAPAMRVLVVHVHSEREAVLAQQLAGDLGGEDLEVVVNVISSRDPLQPGYFYYEGRQSRASAALVARFNDAARRAAIPQWSSQPRALALPAQGAFTADRLDLVLPPLPPPPAAPAPIPAPQPGHDG